MQQENFTAEQELKQLCQSLGLPFEQQDWGIINADGQRLTEFIAYCEANPLSATQKFELGELILASTNERLLNKESLPEILLPFLVRNRRVFEVQLKYWRNLQNDLEFPVGNWIRTNFPDPQNR